MAAFGEQQLIQPIHHLHRIQHLLLLSARVRSSLLAALLPSLLTSLVAPHFSALRAAHAASTVALPPLQTWIDLTPTGGPLASTTGHLCWPDRDQPRHHAFRGRQRRRHRLQGKRHDAG